MQPHHKMKQFKTSKADLVLATLPNGAHNVKVVDVTDLGTCIQYNNSIIRSIGFLPLPKGSYQLLGKLSEITDEVAMGLVDELPVGARWNNYANDYPVWFHTPTESLRSIAIHLGFDVTNNIYLLKKQK
jgi:hypothetical protein